MKKIISPILMCILVTQFAFAQNFTRNPRDTLIKANNSNIEYVGRWYPDNDNMDSSWGNSIEVEVSNTAFISVVLQPDFSNATIDYEYRLYPKNTTPPAKATYLHLTADQLSQPIELILASTKDITLDQNTTYILKFHRRSEALFGFTIFKGFLASTNAQTHKITDKSPIKFEFIGDSITAGFKVDNPSGQSSREIQYENANDAYGPLLAKKFGSDQWSMVAKSGIGIDEIQGSDVPMLARYPYKYFSWNPYPQDAKWDFSKSQPNIIILFLGTNDVVFNAYNPSNFKSKYEALLNMIHDNNTKAKIFCITPLYTTTPYHLPVWDAITTDIHQAVNESDPNHSYIFAIDPGTELDPWLTPKNAAQGGDYAGDMTHPNKMGHKLLAQNLYKIIKANPGVENLLR